MPCLVHADLRSVLGWGDSAAALLFSPLGWGCRKMAQLNAGDNYSRVA